MFIHFKKEKHHQSLKKLQANTLLCKNNKDISKILAADLQSMFSIHTPPAQAVLTVNLRKFGSLYNDYDNTVRVLCIKWEWKKSYETKEYNSNTTQ